MLETIVNARSETLFAKSAFADLAPLPDAGQRLVRMDRRAPPQDPLGGPRRPAGPVIAFAAVWDLWQAPGGAEVASFATVTCAPNAEVAAVHDRMPVILAPDAWPLWLGETEGDPAPLLRPAARRHARGRAGAGG